MAVLRTSSNGTEPVYLYLHEPLALKDGRAVLPELWFTDDADQLCGRGTVLRMRDGGDASAIVHVLPKQETNFAVKDVTTSSVLAERLRGRMLGQLRTIEGIVEELGSQLDLAHDDDASGLMAHWTNTGIKDSATTEACTILLEENDKLKGKVARAPGQAANRLSDVEVQTKLGELRTALKAKQWYSPLLTITGFGGLEHTALDILHVASLGPGKYLAALTVDILGPAALDQLRVRLESLSTTAITDSEAYPAAAMIRRLKTLNELVL
ncbi:unnamed protein product [Tilletia caries]|uniref:Uncharacterized protein n=1 Tax=Tilletia caries TaxID=13290 RepID=A0ABN7J2F7_9BASI|nr:unnamed protein product [Tilletia caries]